MLSKISGYKYNKPAFKQNLHPVDLKYKQAIAKGIQDKFQFTVKTTDLKSIVGPYELKELLKKLKPQNFSLGEVKFAKPATLSDFENIINGTHCVNLHMHTKNSDGSISINEYLEQAEKYGNKLKKINNSNSLPYYVSSITDHNNINGIQEAIAKIAEEQGKYNLYENFKFVPGCEFLFNDNESGFKFTAFEALGYCFNPFDKELQEKLSKFISINLIDKIKEFGGILSYAHPIRYCQGNGTDPKFIEYLKKIGINAIEANYQYLTFKKDEEVLEMIENTKRIASEKDLWQTGGTDSHSSNIFCFKAESFLEELLK